MLRCLQLSQRNCVGKVSSVVLLSLYVSLCLLHCVFLSLCLTHCVSLTASLTVRESEKAKELKTKISHTHSLILSHTVSHCVCVSHFVSSTVSHCVCVSHCLSVSHRVSVSHCLCVSEIKGSQDQDLSCSSSHCLCVPQASSVRRSGSGRSCTETLRPSASCCNC